MVSQTRKDGWEEKDKGQVQNKKSGPLPNRFTLQTMILPYDISEYEIELLETNFYGSSIHFWNEAAQVDNMVAKKG